MQAPEVHSWIVEVKARAQDFGELAELVTFLHRVRAGDLHVWWFEVNVYDLQRPAYVLTISIKEEVHGRTRLRPIVGFSNDPHRCDERRQMGVLLLEAGLTLHRSAGCLSVDGQGLRVSADNASSLSFSIRGLRSSQARFFSLRGPSDLDVEETSEVIASDVAEPDEQLEVFGRKRIETLSRTPLGDGSVCFGAGREEVRGSVYVLSRRGGVPARQPRGPLSETEPRENGGRVRRADRWKLPPAYRFEGVEAIGFRLNLVELGFKRAEVESTVRAIVSPLNVDFPDNGWTPYRIEAASPTLNIELLRYPRMQFDREDETSFQQQHELLVRVLVGRVDEASRQARDAAFFVPAIFVDNVWSKVLGRELQGFDKRLAVFKAKDKALLPSGRTEEGGRIVPLTEVTEVCFRTRVGADEGSELGRLISLGGLAQAKSSKFIDVDRGALTSAFALGGLGWRQTDFEQKEFRRSFARDFMGARRAGFRSLQFAPTDHRLEVGRKRLVAANCRFENVRVSLPKATAWLTLHEPSAEMGAWRLLASLCQGKSLPFGAGDWYRLRCDMTLEVENALRWRS